MLEEQLLNIVEMLVFGFFLGMLIDGYRVIVALCKPSTTTRSVMDILFWVSCGLGAFHYLVRTSSGEARLYVFLLWITGFAIEQKLLGKVLRRTLLLLLKLLLQPVRWCGQCIAKIYCRLKAPFCALRYAINSWWLGDEKKIDN